MPDHTLRPFPPTTNLGAALLFASDWFNDALVGRLQASGWPRFSRTEALVFAFVDEDGTRPVELARRIGISRQSMHTVISKLIQRDLLTTDPDPNDARSLLVRLSSRGNQLAHAASKVIEELEGELAGRIGTEHVESLRRALAAHWGPPPIRPGPAS